MVFVHFIYDLTEWYGLLSWGNDPLFLIVQNWGALAFFLLSGLCATLGKRELKRGALVFGCGLLVTAVTGLVPPLPAIRFGALHCLGCCMMLWHVLKKLPSPVLTAVAFILIPAGFAFAGIRVTVPWLFPLGLTVSGFADPDFFPLLPYLGFFLLGAVSGRRLYAQKRSLLPRVDTQTPIIRFLLLCGRHSLAIYLLHQPVLMLSMELFL